MSKKKYLERLNLAMAAALMLGNSTIHVVAQTRDGLRGTIITDDSCDTDNRSSDPDCFPAGSAGF